MRQTIAYFTGLDERSGALAGDASAALTAKNVVTDHGRLASAPGPAAVVEQGPPGEPTALYVFSDRIGGDTFSYIIVGTKQGVYAYKDDQWRCLFSGASGGDWGFLTYQDDDDTLLIFGNGLDPVQLWNGETPLASALPGAPAKGRFFALHYERVWMCGDFDTPDRVYYSRVMDVTNWSADVEIPDRGGGLVELPTFDGGRVTGLYRVGSDLCVLKSTTALLVYGASPDNYQVVEMSGSLGTIAGRSAAVAGLSSYFLTTHGIGVQSGTTLSLLDDRKLPRLFNQSYSLDGDPCQEGLSPAFGNCAVGIYHNERLYFALPVGQQAKNSLLLEYDLGRQTYMIHTPGAIVAMARAGDMREKLYMLTDQGSVLEWGTAPHPGEGDALWCTPWLDFGTSQRKTITGFSLYGRLFSREGTPYVRVSIQSDLERRTRVLRPRHGGEELYRYRLRIKGRRFQIRLEAQPGTGFCFTGGLEMEVEL